MIFRFLDKNIISKVSINSLRIILNEFVFNLFIKSKILIYYKS